MAASQADTLLVGRVTRGSVSVDELWALRDWVVELSDKKMDFKEMARIIMVEFNATFSRKLSAADVEALVHQIIGSGQHGWQRTDTRPGLERNEASFVAIPNVYDCLDCGKFLSVTQEAPGRRPTFYPKDGLGAPGRLYVKRCDACQLVYHIDGVEKREHLGTLKGVKQMYPHASYNHPRWFRSTGETVIDAALLQGHCANIHLQYASFSSTTKVNTYNGLAKLRTKEGAAGKTPLPTLKDLAERQSLNVKRFEEAFLKYHARHLLQGPLRHFASLVNLHASVDETLEMVRRGDVVDCMCARRPPQPIDGH